MNTGTKVAMFGAPSLFAEVPAVNAPVGDCKTCGFDPCCCDQTALPVIPPVYSEMMNQIAREIYSSLLYWGISSAAEFVGYTGCKEFFEKRYHEERSHAEKFFAYLNDKQFCVQIPAIDAVVVQARTIQEFFQMSLDHEKKVTAFLNRLYEMAFSSRDNATAIFMEWFVREQVEEEAMMKNILDRINLAQGNTAALLQIDAELKS